MPVMTPWHSLKQPIAREEEMDALTLPDAHYAAVLRDLGRINAITLATRPTLAFVKSVARAKAHAALGARRAAGGATVRHRPAKVALRILDVGFGDGGMLRAIARWAAFAHVDVDLVGIDLNPRSAKVAEAATPPDLRIRWLTGDYAALGGQDWDIIISSLVAHHMTRAQRGDFMRFMTAEAQCGWFINDLHRRRLPFAGYPLLATLWRTDPIVRRDGQLSVGRSFRRDEWLAELAEAAVSNARVERWFPYRLCVAWQR
jgi:SAM-dependent methyltransferase